MVYIYSEGKFNDNTYLLDGRLYGIPNFLAVYIIENNDMRMMIDTPSNKTLILFAYLIVIVINLNTIILQFF